jgi:hypothetical protein
VASAIAAMLNMNNFFIMCSFRLSARPGCSGPVIPAGVGIPLPGFYLANFMSLRISGISNLAKGWTFFG